MSEHTPGPWRIAPAKDYSDSEINIDAGKNGLDGFICSPGHRGDDEAMANAFLIVAAPDMLAELRRLHEKHGEQVTADVIAKAEGR